MSEKSIFDKIFDRFFCMIEGHTWYNLNSIPKDFEMLQGVLIPKYDKPELICISRGRRKK